jgi:hypothetical protein
VHDGFARFNAFAFQRLSDEVLCEFGISAAHEHPTNDEPAEDIEHYEQREPLALMRAAQLGD